MSVGSELDLSDWTVVMVSYNSARDLADHWSGGVPAGLSWVVVDNASRDNSVELARSLGAQVIEMPTNLGFARSNNAALHVCSTEFVAFVNPDVHVRFSDLPGLGRTAVDFKTLVAPQLVNPDGTPQPNARGLPYLADKLAHRGVRLGSGDLTAYLPDTFTEKRLHWVAWAMGAAVCGRRADFETIGGWDERFFLYYEDHELGLQAWEAGLRVAVDSRIDWVHSWRRATKSRRLGPWRREIASAARFYRRRPGLAISLRRRVVLHGYPPAG